MITGGLRSGPIWSQLPGGSSHEILLHCHCQAGGNITRNGIPSISNTLLTTHNVFLGYCQFVMINKSVVARSLCACCSANNACDELNNEKVNTE